MTKCPLRKSTACPNWELAHLPALTLTLVPSVSTKHPCKPCWFLSLALRPQPAVASWQFGDNCLDLQSVAFLKTILLQSELSHPLWLFWWQWRAGSRGGLFSPPLCPSASLRSIPCSTSDWLCRPHWLYRKLLLYPYLVSHPPCYHWWQLLDQFSSVPSLILAGT